jgi:hypothetical protein
MAKMGKINLVSFGKALHEKSVDRSRLAEQLAAAPAGATVHVVGKPSAELRRLKG